MAKEALEAVNIYSNELIKEADELSIIQKCQVSSSPIRISEE